MNIKSVLGNANYEVFPQIVKEFVNPTGNKLAAWDQNPYFALQLCDDVIEVINTLISGIKEEIKNKVTINLSRITRLRDNKIVITECKKRLLEAVQEEEHQAFEMIEEIEKLQNQRAAVKWPFNFQNYGINT